MNTQRAKLRTADLRDQLPERIGCPHPHKYSFASRAHAKRALRNQVGKGQGSMRGKLRAYLCSCGRWHVGSTRDADHLTGLRVGVIPPP